MSFSYFPHGDYYECLCSDPSTIEQALHTISQHQGPGEYVLEVRRENILADCLANLDRKDFSPSKKIMVKT